MSETENNPAQENNQQAPISQLDIAKMKKFYKAQIDLSKLRTEFHELETRYVKAKVEYNHFTGLLAQQEMEQLRAETAQAESEAKNQDDAKAPNATPVNADFKPETELSAI